MHNEKFARNFALAGLLVFIASYSINGYFNYSAALVGDIHLYLNFTKELLKGSFTYHDSVFETLRAGFPDFCTPLTAYSISPDIRCVSIVTPGIHLLFAPFYAITHDNVFWLVPILFDILMIMSLFGITVSFYNKLSTDKSLSWYAALAAISLYGTLVNFRLNLRRDTLCAALLMLASWYIIRAIKSRKMRFWHGAMAIIAFMTLIKPTLVIFVIPLALVFFHLKKLVLGDLRWMLKNFLLSAAIGAFFFLLFAIGNFAATGSWLSMAQMKGFTQYGYLIAKVLMEAPGLFSAQASIFSFGNVWPASALLTLIVFTIGLLAAWQYPFIRLWAAPSILILYGFYGIWFYNFPGEPFAYNIYLSPAYPLIVFFVLIGAVAIVQKLLPGKTVPAVIAGSIILLCIFIGFKTYRSLPEHRYAKFQVDEARQLSSDLCKVIEPNSVLLCDKFLSLAIDYFTPVRSFPPSRLGSSDSAVAKKIVWLMDHGIPVYFCDYRGIEGSWTYLNGLKQFFYFELLSRQPIYDYPSDYGYDPVSIYKISLPKSVYEKSGGAANGYKNGHLRCTRREYHLRIFPPRAPW